MKLTKYYAKNYEDAIKFAWQEKNDFTHSNSIEHIGQVECLKVYDNSMIHYMTIFWDESLYNDSERFYQVN